MKKKEREGLVYFGGGLAFALYGCLALFFDVIGIPYIPWLMAFIAASGLYVIKRKEIMGLF